MQKVALVFARVQAFEQLIVAIHFAHARIVAGGDQLRAEAHGVVEKGFEFDFGVAQLVGIRCVLRCIRAEIRQIRGLCIRRRS